MVNGKNSIDLDTSRTPSPVMNNNNDKDQFFWTEIGRCTLHRLVQKSTELWLLAIAVKFFNCTVKSHFNTLQK